MWALSAGSRHPPRHPRPHSNWCGFSRPFHNTQTPSGSLSDRSGYESSFSSDRSGVSYHCPPGQTMSAVINVQVLCRRARDSPCFQHDHPLMTQHSAPPFRAGEWEMDWKHRIEVQFDHHGVASACKSTRQRGRPWIPEQHKLGLLQAESKIQMEVFGLIDRLGLGDVLWDENPENPGPPAPTTSTAPATPSTPSTSTALTAPAAPAPPAAPAAPPAPPGPPGPPGPPYPGPVHYGGGAMFWGMHR